MHKDLILVPDLEKNGPAGGRQNFQMVWTTRSIGTITLLKQELSWEWSLPLWTIEPEQELWEQLCASLRKAQQAEQIEVARAWLPVGNAREEEQPSDRDSTVFTWLQAVSRTAPAASYYDWRYPDARDAIELAHVVAETQARTVAGAQGTLGQSIDATVAVFARRWGPLLEACSVVVEARHAIGGAALTTFYGQTPLIALLATASPLVARDLLMLVLDSLADVHYPTVNLLLEPGAPYMPVAVALGFKSIVDVQQVLVPC